MGLDFTTLRGGASFFRYFQAFPHLNTLMTFGIRRDPNLDMVSRGIERGLALHVHNTQNFLIAHQWAYNGSHSKGEIHRDRFVVYSDRTGNTFNVYNAAKDEIAAPPSDEEIMMFRHCLARFETTFEGPGEEVWLELEKLDFNWQKPLGAIFALDCGTWPDSRAVGNNVQTRGIDFNRFPLTALRIQYACLPIY